MAWKNLSQDQISRGSSAEARSPQRDETILGMMPGGACFGELSAQDQRRLNVDGRYWPAISLLCRARRSGGLQRRRRDLTSGVKRFFSHELDFCAATPE